MRVYSERVRVASDGASIVADGASFVADVRTRATEITDVRWYLQVTTSLATCGARQMLHAASSIGHSIAAHVTNTYIAMAVQGGMRFTTLLSMFVFLCACGDNGDGNGGGGGTDGGVTVDSSVDAPPAPAMITISGMATKREGLNQTPAEGATVAAYKNSDPNTPVATTTVDAAGMYSITIETGGVAVDGFLEAKLEGFLDLYLYPPKPLTADYDGASLNIVDETTVSLLGQICRPNYDPTKGLIAAIVADSAGNPIAGATASSNPAAENDCYNGETLPDPELTESNTDGIVYLLGVPAGEVTVSATLNGTTFGAHKVTARAGTFTTTVIQQ